MPNRHELHSPSDCDEAPDREMVAYQKTVEGKRVTGNRYSYKGMGRQIRRNKRVEAEIRNSKSEDDNRREPWRKRGWKRKSVAVMCGQA